MSKSISGEMLSKEIMKALEGYVDDIENDVKDSTNSVIKEAKKELVQTSPRSGAARNTKYYKGWAVKNGGKTRKGRYYSKVIWNKTNYQLTHLLENKHHKRDGTGWVEAQPHIGKVQEKYGTKFADLLEEKIRRSSK